MLQNVLEFYTFVGSWIIFYPTTWQIIFAWARTILKYPCTVMHAYAGSMRVCKMAKDLVSPQLHGITMVLPN